MKACGWTPVMLWQQVNGAECGTNDSVARKEKGGPDITGRLLVFAG